jgi:hypothetical protein
MSKFYIVNDFDRPWEERIAERRPDGLFYYIHPMIRNKREHHGMNPATPTPLEDFGIQVHVEGGQIKGTYLHTTRATYRDGRLRRWKGSECFSFSYRQKEGAK